MWEAFLTIVLLGVAMGFIVSFAYFVWLVVQYLIFLKQESCNHDHLRYKDWHPEKKWQCRNCDKLL